MSDFGTLVVDLASSLPHRELTTAFDRLSASYEGDHRVTRIETAADAAAYAIGRGTSSCSALERVLGEVARARPDWRPRTVLDLGAGVGSASWASTSIFDSVEAITLVERSTEMIALGRALCARSLSGALRRATWLRGDAADPPIGMWDLVLSAYLVGELPENEQMSAVGRWFEATTGELVIVDIGSPSGFDGVLRARKALIQGGATISAPCPHEGTCPMNGGDWCHFGVRVARSRLQRQVKGGVRSFEDEKYSYVVASMQGPVERTSRILRRPEIRSGHVRLHLCTPNGLDKATVSRRIGDAYKRARKAAWGDGW